MPKRVHTAVHVAKDAALDPPLDRPRAEPGGEQLPARQQSVLTFGNRGRSAIQLASAPFTTCSVVNGALVSHRPIVPGIGAPVARRSSDLAHRQVTNLPHRWVTNAKRGSNPPLPPLALIP
jgi:hypothetical protein